MRSHRQQVPTPEMADPKISDGSGLARMFNNQQGRPQNRRCGHDLGQAASRRLFNLIPRPLPPKQEQQMG